MTIFEFYKKKNLTVFEHFILELCKREAISKKLFFFNALECLHFNIFIELDLLTF